MAQTYDIYPISNIQTFSIQGKLERNCSDVYFFVVLSGEIELKIGDDLFYMNAQDVLMAGPHDTFTARGGGGNIVLIVNMRADFFILGQSERLGIYICNSKKDRERDYTNLRRILSQIALNHYEKNDIANARRNELAYSLLYYLNKYHYVPKESNTNDKSSKYSDRHSKIFSFLEKNYMNPITLSDLARHVFLTPTYLSRFFKKNMDSNFSVVLNNMRLEYATEELLNSSSPITTIAFNNGFTSSYAFNNLFKEHNGCTPNDYRKRHVKPAEKYEDQVTTQISTSDFVIAEQQLNKYALAGIDDSIRYPLQKLFHVKNVNSYTPTIPIWNSMINIGYGSILSNSNVQTQLTLIQKEIGFKYGRIQGVLNNEFTPCLHDDVFNYSDLDRHLEFLLSINLIPFLDLTFKPNYMFLTNKDFVYPLKRDEHNSESEQLFLQKVSALIRHCINTFGLSVAERWGFEIGYSHDEYLNLVESPADFVRRFASCYRIIKAVLPCALVGGISHNVTIEVSTFSSITDEMARNNFSPDFISLSAFPYEKNKSQNDSVKFVLSSDPNFISSKIMKIKEILASYPKLTQSVFITVLGVDVRTRNHINDSCFQSTFFVKNTIDLVGQVEAIGYWQLSDIGSEYFDTARILFGGTGLLTKHGLKKPGFSALKRLSYCNTQLIQKGDGYLVTTNSNNAYTIVLSNYAHFDDFYCVSKFSMPPDKVYSVFKDPTTHSFSFSLHKMKPGRYKVVTTSLGREYGSLLDEWLRYGILDDLQPREIRYLQDIVHPQWIARFVDCQDGILELHVQLLPHETKFIEITREL